MPYDPNKLDEAKKAAIDYGFDERLIDKAVMQLDSQEVTPGGLPTGDIGESDNVFDESFAGRSQPLITGSKSSVTTPFGASSGADVFSGGINYGIDLAVGYGTTVSAPPEGQWEVIQAFGGANPKGGYVGNAVNQGYGNSVFIKNLLTGEKLKYSHLSSVGVRPGQIIMGGEAIGKSGNSGNSTGAHLDIEYYDAGGRIRDPLRSKYGAYL